MSILVGWDSDAHTVVRWNFERRWTWEEFAAAQAQSNDLIRSVGHTVHLIGDLRRSRLLPDGALWHYRQVLERGEPENVGAIVLVGAGLVVKQLAQVFYRVNQQWRNNFEFAPSLEVARQLLAARRPGATQMAHPAQDMEDPDAS